MENKQKAALFIDGQNMLPFNYYEMHRAVAKYDTLIKRVYLSRKDVEYHKGRDRDIIGKLQNNGFEIIVAGHLDNVDPYLISDAMEIICERRDIEAIVLSSGDSDLVPVVNKAKLKGKYAILITTQAQEGVSSALKHLVNEHIEIPAVGENKEQNDIKTNC